MSPNPLPAQAIDLSSCDKEPIHIIGSIQPHGWLISCRLPGWEITQISENTQSFLGLSAENLLGQVFTAWLNLHDKERLEQHLQAAIETSEPKALKLAVTTPQGTGYFIALVHQNESAQGAILELEPTIKDESLLSFVEFYEQFTASINRLQNIPTTEALCQAAVRELQSITGFDRVFIHRVVEDGHLKVIAEQKRAEQNPFLGLHFPASDIPKQARQLYTLNRLRFISDVDAIQAKIIPRLNPNSGQPLDLSQTKLRAVAPVHLEYLRNMKVKASMSVTLVKNGELWGLISCHHASPQFLNYEKRAACEFLGRMVSLQIPILEGREEAEAELKLRKHLAEILKLLSIADSAALIAAIRERQSDFLAMVNADGAAICIHEEIPLIVGVTPPVEAIRAIGDFVMQGEQQMIISTDALTGLFPEAEDWLPKIGGLLAVSLSKHEKYLVLWFRQEQCQVIPWGGDPSKPVLDSNDRSELKPRRSFEKWNETVRGKSAPWEVAERIIAAEFRHRFMSLVIQRAAEISQLNLQLARSNDELASFAYVASHDLKEPLRGIHAYASFLLEDYSDKLDDEGKKNLDRLMSLTDQMNALIDSLLQFSRVGRMELQLQNIDFTELIEGLGDSLRPRLEREGATVRIVSPLPRVLGDRLRLTEVMQNLIVNAVKYNEQAKKSVEIGCFTRTDATHKDETVFFVRDNGIGIEDEYHDLIFKIFRRLHPQDLYGGGAGAGLTITKKIIERHGGRIWFESKLGIGTSFFFTLHPENVEDFDQRRGGACS